MAWTAEQHEANVKAVLMSKALSKEMLYELLEAAWDMGSDAGYDAGLNGNGEIPNPYRST